jgi:hypothetical protein
MAKRLITLLLSAFFLISCDAGGLVKDYINLPASEIRGYCASACTMRMLNGCVHPEATLMFHGPSHFGFPLPERDFEYWSRIIARHYPEKLRKWYMSEGRYTTTYMTGREVIEMGARECNG